MGSRPIRGKMLDALAALSDSLNLTDPQADREDKATAYTLHYLSGGTPFDTLRQRSRLPTVTSLAQYLALQGCDISRPLLQNWLTNEGTARGKERADLYRTRVKQQGAAALVDRGLEVLESAKPHESSLAQAQAKAGNWVAERLDRETWGQPSPTQGGTSTHLHLHAALARPLAAGSPPLNGSLGTAGVGGYLTGSESRPTESEPLLPRDTGVEIGTLPPVSGTPPVESGGQE